MYLLIQHVQECFRKTKLLHIQCKHKTQFIVTTHYNVNFKIRIALYRRNTLPIANNLSTCLQITSDGLIKLFPAITGVFIEIKFITFAENQNARSTKTIKRAKNLNE